MGRKGKFDQKEKKGPGRKAKKQGEVKVLNLHRPKFVKKLPASDGAGDFNKPLKRLVHCCDCIFYVLIKIMSATQERFVITQRVRQKESKVCQKSRRRENLFEGSTRGEIQKV